MEIVKSEAETGKVLINKLAAAEQQLAAAIRMYFMEEDALAIHSVASAAHSLYADLLRHRGKDPAFHIFGFGVLSVAKRYVDGDLTNKDLESWGEGTLEAIQPFVDILRENPELDINEFTVSGSAEEARKFYGKIRHAYNFLKHADRDASAVLDSAKINNEDLLYQAINCSLHLNCQLTPEKEFFVAAMHAFGKLEVPKIHLKWFLQALSREEVMYLARTNLCYPRVDDDHCIDFDLAQGKALQSMKDSREMQGKAEG
ncbi:MAG: hypothetical protein F4145_13380 [Boseongicola sp. SB0675_bin_26]|nr:hypothetical protein [Boseongicola sp. SB0675_bin_26]